MTLATTLMVAAIALLASFSLVGSSVVQLAVDYRLNNRQIAHNLAETALADAVRRGRPADLRRG